MTKLIIQFLTVVILIPVIDFVWLAKVMNDFYMSELGSLARTVNGKFEPIIWAAVVVYLAIAAGVVIFVLPKAAGSLKMCLFYGAIMGAVIYAVYDFTNLSLVQNWPLKMSLVDVVWGATLTAICSAAAEYVGRLLPQ